MIPNVELNISSPKSDTIICSMGLGENYVNMLNIMGKTIFYYAHLHNMEPFLLALVDQRIDYSRPPA